MPDTGAPHALPYPTAAEPPSGAAQLEALARATHAALAALQTAFDAAVAQRPRIVRGYGVTQGGVADVTFPAGTFTTRPVVLATLGAYAANVGVLVTNVSTSGARVQTYNLTTGSNVADVPVEWAALGT